jgi:hypothetical protein
MKLQDYIKYYIGCNAITTDDNERAELVGVSDDNAHLVHSRTGSYGTCDVSGVKLVLRRLEDMTEEEAIGLLQSMVPDDMDDKPIDAEYGIEMFHNDGGNLVDADVLVGAEYNCRCYTGQVTIKKCGTVCAYDESGDEQELVNAPRAYHYLLTQHFDLFGLIDAGLAVDQKTITP